MGEEDCLSQPFQTKQKITFMKQKNRAPQYNTLENKT